MRTVSETMLHPVRGLLIGPLVVPVAYWIGTVAHAWATGFQLSLLQGLRELGVIAAFGLPIAYAAAFLWLAPAFYLLRRFGWLRASTLVVAGALGGAIVGAWFNFEQQGALFRVRLSIPSAAILGGIAALTCWWAGRGKTENEASAKRRATESG